MGYREVRPMKAMCAESVYGFRFRCEDERRVVKRWVASDERRPTGGDESSSALQASTYENSSCPGSAARSGQPASSSVSTRGLLEGEEQKSKSGLNATVE